ncbi:MAG: DUF6427 family protein [Bacteroidota bacterium]
MFVSTFNNNNSINYIFLVIIGLLLSIIPILSEGTFVFKGDMPLYQLVEFVVPENIFLYKALGAVVIIVLSLLFNNLITSYEMIKNTFLPGFFFLLLFFSNSMFVQLSPMHFSLLFLIMALDEIFYLSKEECKYDNIFNTGFYIAIASLFYFPAIFIFPIVFFGISYFRSDSAREIFISLSGLLIPYLFLLSYLFFVNKHLAFLLNIKENYFHVYIAFDKYNIYAWTVLILLAASFFSFGSKFYEGNARVRKFRYLFYFLLLFTLVIQLFSKIKLSDYLFFAAAPIAVFYTEYFQGFKKKWVAELIVVLFLGLVVYNQIIT